MTQFDTIKKMLRNRKKPMTVADIAEKTGFIKSSIRRVLYGNNDFVLHENYGKVDRGWLLA